MVVIFGLPATDGSENSNEDFVRQIKDMGPRQWCHAIQLHNVKDKLDRVDKHNVWRYLSSEDSRVGVCGSNDDFEA